MNFELPYLRPSVWLIQESNMSKKWYERVLQPRVFLRMLLSSFCFWNRFWFEQEPWPLGTIRAHTYSGGYVAHFLCSCSESTRILCSQPPEHCMQMSVARNGSHMVLICSAHAQAPSSSQVSYTKHKFKDEIIKNFKGATAEHWTKPGALLRMGSRETAEFTRLKLPLSGGSPIIVVLFRIWGT